MVIRVPTLSKSCYCLSLRTGVKIFGFLSLVDCVSVYISTPYALKHAVKDCSAEQLACGVVLADVLLRTVYGVFVVALLMSVYRAAHPRYILWWVYSTLFITFVTSVIMVPAIDKFTRNTQSIYYALCLWDLYACFVAYSYYIELTEGRDLSNANSDEA